MKRALPDFFKSLNGDDVEDIEQLRFLHDEGLDLLVAFKKISDPDVRAMVKALIDRLGDGGTVN